MSKKLIQTALSASLSLGLMASPILAETAFNDIDPQFWYAEGLSYCLSHGLMTGKSETRFDPNGLMTRAMAITVLYRADGSPKTQEEVSFLDVPENSYYRNAIAWASKYDIAHGYDAYRFGPDIPITREQLALMLKNFSDYTGYSPVIKEDLSQYQDQNLISGFAKDAMAWAIEQGVITGKNENTLDPQGLAKRAECAQMIMRLLKSNDHFGGVNFIDDGVDGIPSGYAYRVLGQGLIDCGRDFIVGLKSNGKPVGTGANDYDKRSFGSSWKNLAGLVAGNSFVLGKTSDGHVLTTGRAKNWAPQEALQNVQLMYAHGYDYILLYRDGTVFTPEMDTANNEAVRSWKNVTYVSNYNYDMFGVDSQGKPLAAPEIGYSTYEYGDFMNWDNLVAIIPGRNFVVGLKKDGTVVAAGNNDYGQCNVQDWKSVDAIAVGENHVVARTTNARLLATGLNNHGQCEVSNFKNVTAVAAKENTTAFITKDGKAHYVGANPSRVAKVSGWKDMCQSYISNFME